MAGRVLDAIDLRELAKRVKRQQKRPAAAEVVAIDARVRSLEQLFADGRITHDEWMRTRDLLLGKRVAAEQEVVDQANSTLPLELARKLPQAWPRLTTAEQRRIVRALVAEVRVSKANGNGSIDASRVKIRWR